MCLERDHLFSGQTVLPSLPISHQCTPHVSPPPHFQILEKNAFSALFKAKISAHKRQNFLIFTPRPLIYQGKPAPKTQTFGNPHGTYPQKKSKIQCGFMFHSINWVGQPISTTAHFFRMKVYVCLKNNYQRS